MKSLKEPAVTPLIHIIRHGESLHNVCRRYPHRDPPLTDAGQEATKKITITAVPDLVIVSPMTRTIQTAMNAFPAITSSHTARPEVQVWPDLREAHNAVSCKGVSRRELSAKFPPFDFSDCPEEWDHPPHTAKGATARAEIVRQRLKELSETYKNIALVTHRGFIAFLAPGDRFEVCETRSYRFGTGEETEMLRLGVNVDTNEMQDFGPTILVPVETVGARGDLKAILKQ
ncbi:phosphoglycerate mutase-like protein [Myriangium duriaei CBS 260.36]|uniref:Phosphoglycerate mutase-like protein n=1 Tax=Myriangium duriaei CBS 260.36 TaxID=1168546 RepID=A0A9P4MD04_9PEZI|nr:phosphoglycerate mutase-like protein [Myriangium duriaei CBS 260.36]